MHANIDDEGGVLAAHLDLADTVVVTLSDTDRNRHICHAARTRYGISHIVTLVTDTNRLVEFETLNVTVYNPALGPGRAAEPSGPQSRHLRTADPH